MAGIGKKFMNKVNSALGNDKKNEEEEEDHRSEKEIENQERRIKAILENIIKIYIEKGIVGEVEISLTIGFFNSSLSCEIDENEDINPSLEDDLQPDENLTKLQKLAINRVNKALEKLGKRSLAYVNKPYKKNLSLSSSVTVGDPMGLTSLSIEISATTESLLRHFLK